MTLDQGLFCPACQYDLRGIGSDRCPECGFAFDRTQLSASRIPWLHRREIGRVRAYLRTINVFTIRSRDLAAEMARPVSLREAQLFRWVTVIIIFVAVCGTVSILRPDIPWLGLQMGWDFQEMGAWADLFLPLVQGYSLWPLIMLYALLLLIGVTGVASYWFHPRALPVELQNRALALSYYTCAPLVWLAPCLLVIAVTPWVDRPRSPWLYGLGNPWAQVAGPVAIIVWAGAVFGLLGWWLHTVRVLRWTTHCSAGRLIAAMVGIPPSWLLVGFFALVALPWCIGFVILFFQNLP
jgi:hypothetical protein